jgi:hypothetical protein
MQGRLTLRSAFDGAELGSTGRVVKVACRRGLTVIVARVSTRIPHCKRKLCTFGDGYRCLSLTAWVDTFFIGLPGVPRNRNIGPNSNSVTTLLA